MVSYKDRVDGSGTGPSPAVRDGARCGVPALQNLDLGDCKCDHQQGGIGDAINPHAYDTLLCHSLFAPGSWN